MIRRHARPIAVEVTAERDVDICLTPTRPLRDLRQRAAWWHSCGRRFPA
jgi:hypothetical protein